jgi:hypothetical protein
MLATRSWLHAAADSSPAALRAALALYARRLGEAGRAKERADALALRRSIDLGASDPKVERLARLLADGTPTLVTTEHSATVLYLRDRLAEGSPAWCTRRIAGWRHTLIPRERLLEWFKAGAPDVAPWVLIARSPLDTNDLGRIARVVGYDPFVEER